MGQANFINNFINKFMGHRGISKYSNKKNKKNEIYKIIINRGNLNKEYGFNIRNTIIKHIP